MSIRKKELISALKIYGFTWLLVLALFLWRVVDQDTSVSEALSFFVEAIGNTTFLIAVHVLFAVIYLVFLISRYFLRLYQRKGLKTSLKRFSLWFLSPVLVLILSFRFITYSNSNEEFNFQWDSSIENKTKYSKDLFSKDGKHRGMSVFGWRGAGEQAISDLVRNNIEWVAVIPFLYQEDEQTKAMNVPEAVGSWSRRDSVFIRSINNLHARNIRVHLKPHLWMNSGWRSNINFNSKGDWDIWFESYRKNMLHYARLAEELKVGLFCVGTELRTSLKNQEKDWVSLIKEIKAIYKGKLTYAANWDDKFDQADFWNELDYIGVQAYFPLTQKKNPNLMEIKQGWEKHMEKLENIALTYGKPILFTEVGYKSEASATIKPWEWGSFLSILYKQKSDKTQQLAYEAMFQQFWGKDWFSGSYIWQWDTRTSAENAPKDLDFSPRFKPAQNTMAKWYGKIIY